MFFIGGVVPGSRALNYQGTLSCKFCGSQTRCRVVMTYYCFTFFFIPLFKWGKRYMVQMLCCGAVYELSPEKGKAIARGEQTEIGSEDLKLVKEGEQRIRASMERTDGAGEEIPPTRRCPVCKYEAPGEYRYCPNCGQRLR